MSSLPSSADPFGIQKIKATKSGGQVWYIYNTDFNDDPQVYTYSASNEYVVHNVQDADGTRFTISQSDAFETYISTTAGFHPEQCITDQQQMVNRGYMQSVQDWKNVEFTAQFVIFKEAADYITVGFRGGKLQGNGSPSGCPGCGYLVDISMQHGGLIRVRKQSWNISVHNWLSTLASGFDAGKVCGFTFKVLVYNTTDGNGVNIDVYVDTQNDNHFVKVLSGTDTGQINTDATTCNCTKGGQPLVWGSPAVLLKGSQGQFGFKNMSIREIDGYGQDLPPVDPGGSGGGGSTDPGSGGSGGTGSGAGGGSTGGGGGEPVDLTPILATPKTQEVIFGGGPNYDALEFQFIFAGKGWNGTATTGSGTSTSSVVYANPIFADKDYTTRYIDKGIFTADGTKDPFVEPLEVWFIFAGASWTTTQNKALKDNIMAKMNTLFNKTTYFEGALQYGATRKPVLKGSYVLTAWGDNNNRTEFPVYYTNTDVYIATQHFIYGDGPPEVPYPTQDHPNVAYFVIPTPGKTPTMDGTSATVVGGFHDVTTNWVSNDYTQIDIMGTGWSDYGSTNLDSITYVISHEIIEMVTDPVPYLPDITPQPIPKTGYDYLGYCAKHGTPLDTYINQFGAEMADICESATGSHVLSGVNVAPYWSDWDGGCIISNKAIAGMTCPPGYTYNSTLQRCQKTVTTTNPGDIIASQSLQDQLKNAISTIFSANSVYFDGLYQFGLMKRPKVGKMVVNTTAPELQHKYTQQDIDKVIDDSIAKGQVPKTSATNRNIAYMVLVPPGLETDGGTYGRHWCRIYNNNGSDPQNMYYDIIGCAGTEKTFDFFTEILTHEIIECCTNNNTNDKGYIIKPDSKLIPAGKPDQNELCDVCTYGGGQVKNTKYLGINVATYYSDQDGLCTIPATTGNPMPWVSCQTGAVFNKDKEQCDLLPGQGGGGTAPGGTASAGYHIAAATASDDDGHVPGNAVDGKLDTRWSAFGKGQYILLDLGTAKPVDKVKIAWYQGDQRSNSFKIQTAETQGGAFTTQLDTTSTKGSATLQDYLIKPANPVRFIKIIVNGNSINDWASISEVEIWGQGAPSGTPGTGTGGDPGSGGIASGGDTGGGTQTPPPPPEVSYNFFDTSFSCDYQKIGLCNPVE